MPFMLNLLILHQAGGELEDILFQHHCETITKCKTIEEAIFYLQETVNNGWSRSALENALTANCYQQKGKAITNFKEHLPAPQSKLAQETLKAPYNIDFLTMCEDYDERNLDTAVDKLLKQEEDNPTIGLLICKTKR